jgi:hypothetical protein
VTVKRPAKTQHYYRSLEIALSWFPALTILVCSLQFFTKGNINIFTLPLGLATSLAYASYYLKKFKKGSYIPLLLLTVLAIFFASYSISKLFFDTSYDGQWYHLQTALFLAKGWNPFDFPGLREWIISTTALPHFFVFEKGLIFTIHYTKGYEMLLAAAMNCFHQVIVNPSFYSVIFTITIFLSSNRILKSFTSINKKIRFLFALAITCNPILIAQFAISYVDGAMAYATTLLLLTLIDYIRNHDQISLYTAALTMLLVINIKFTGLVFVVVFVGGFGVYLIATKTSILYKKYFAITGLAFILGFALVGFQPYITNAVQYNGNFLYPALVVSDHHLDTEMLIKNQANSKFLQRNRVEKFFISIFSERSNILKAEPKIQFPINYNGKSDYAARFGGFGATFGLSIILSILLIFFVREKTIITAVILTWISLFAIGEAWWARYVPQAWLIPILTALGIFIRDKNCALKYNKTIAIALLIITMINILFVETLSYTKKPYFEMIRNNIDNNQVVYLNMPQNQKYNGTIFTWMALQYYGIKVDFQQKPSCKEIFIIPNTHETAACILNTDNIQQH